MKLAEVVKFLEDKDIDDEHMAYFPNEFPFTRDEYMEVFYHLDKISEGRQYEVPNAYFPETFAYFNHQGTKFIWRLLIGQGSACQLFPAENDRSFEFNDELEIIL